MEAPGQCPICARTTPDLATHLTTHSKQDLIASILHGSKSIPQNSSDDEGLPYSPITAPSLILAGEVDLQEDEPEVILSNLPDNPVSDQERPSTSTSRVPNSNLGSFQRAWIEPTPCTKLEAYYGDSEVDGRRLSGVHWLLDDSNSSISGPRGQEGADQDLHTDEELPPVGEISEYEESISIASSNDNSLPHSSRPFSPSKKRSYLESRRLSPAFSGFSSPKGLRGTSTSPRPAPPPPTERSFSCFDCLQNFNSLFELIEHKVDEHKTGPNEKKEEDIKVLNVIRPKGGLSGPKNYFCIYCSYSSKGKKGLAAHLIEEHPDKPIKPDVFECSVCGKGFPKRMNLRKHHLVHTEKKFTCPEESCGKSFVTNFKLQEHYRLHVGVLPYKCDVEGCSKLFRTSGNLSTHKAMSHNPDKRPRIRKKTDFYCRVCNKILHSKVSLENHMQIHGKPKKCPFCTELFTRSSTLVRHIRLTHDPFYQTKDSTECTICQKSFHVNSLKIHMRVHLAQKPFSCRNCSKTFRTRGNLALHAWSHTNADKPYKCIVCAKSYIFKKDLENHSIVHKRKNMFYACNECGLKFSYKTNMKRHLEEHFAEKKHKCHCGKAFHRKYYLVEHQKTHSGIKPYACNICGKNSASRSNHRAHMRIHDSRGESGNLEG